MRACFLTFLLATLSAALWTAVPDHVIAAQRFISVITPENNSYSTNRIIVWPADGTIARNETVCSSFITALLMHTYAIPEKDIAAWFGSPNPKARVYHRAIERQNGFLRITNIRNIQSGDILAIRYPAGTVSDDGYTNSGHVVVVSGIPKSMHQKPFISNTVQYAVRIIDCSSSGHGRDDTRARLTITGIVQSTGAGEGTMRLYAYSNGMIAGYSWSTSSASAYYPATERSVAVGRINRSGIGNTASGAVR
ncbi:MAG: hypothetical protein HZC28_13155 [Spirochaetes bacterium]|nr:hypothetical protein [Spirochaetota bacterium]